MSAWAQKAKSRGRTREPGRAELREREELPKARSNVRIRVFVFPTEWKDMVEIVVRHGFVRLPGFFCLGSAFPCSNRRRATPAWRARLMQTVVIGHPQAGYAYICLA